MNTSLNSSMVRGLIACLACASLCAAQSTGGSAPIATPSAPAPRAQETPKFLRYVRAGANGAKVRNIYDAQGVVLLDAAPQALFAVHSERGSWLEVEAPGGFSVWVFGEFVQPTGTPGVLQISAADVRMRPLPSSGPESLPLRQLLGLGQRVQLKARKDLSKPLGEDWVNVWSPAGTRAWVAASEVEPVPSGTDGPALWATACVEARKAVGAAGATEASATAPKVEAGKLDSKDVSKALADAERALTAERAKEEQGGKPDYAAPRAAFEAVLALQPSAATAELVRGRVELCKGYEEGYALRSELEQQRVALDAALKKRQEDMEKASKRGVFEGRFDARGWLERVDMPGESHAIYLIRWAGESTAELVCTTGRFDLDDFVDVEIGIVGRELRGVLRGPSAALTRPREIDVARIEVISGRKALK